MPKYTFDCQNCKTQFSDFFTMNQSDGTDVICPSCQGKKLKRVYKPTAVRPNGITKETTPATCSSGTCGM